MHHQEPGSRGTAADEPESFSPLALGLSMSIDYQRRIMTMARRLPEEDRPTCGCRCGCNRLATVRGLVDENHSASFVVDTGGQVISISTSTARGAERPQIGRKITLRVWGASGWDPDAYLLPGVQLAFSDIRYRDYSVVVLNLRAPSVLLGYELGGIVGHQFLSRYRVSFDLERAELRLKKSSSRKRPGAAEPPRGVRVHGGSAGCASRSRSRSRTGTGACGTPGAAAAARRRRLPRSC